MRIEDDHDAKPPPPDDRARLLLDYVTAVFAAIDFGDLFAAAPANPEDRKRHETGVYLLDALRELLQAEVAQRRTDAADAGAAPDPREPSHWARALKGRRP